MIEVVEMGIMEVDSLAPEMVLPGINQGGE